MGIPTAILNPDAIPGKANRYLSTRADAIFVQWPVTRRHFQNSESVQVVGCPVRPAFSQASREAGLERYGLDQRKRTLLITGASQGARSINEAIIAVFDRLGGEAGLDGWQFLHLTGTQDCDRVANAYQVRSLPAKVLPYTEHMADALAAADLVVSRAGASTLAELTAVGVGSVLMPYPHHRDKHQLANAGVLADAGAAVVVEDRVQVEQNAKVLAGVLDQLMGDGAVLSEMAERAAALGTCQAAATIADQVLAMGVGGVRGGNAQCRASSTDAEQGRELRSYGDSDLPTDIKVGTM
jgi:UDP-N-acetylglucosamine--N-acetylmuramyl-(pentapeptide) pyrophosphoryl-undecaprenol N-acetylglucosamine transferase